MAKPSKPSPVPDGRAGWPVVALGLVATAWAVFLLIRQYADRLRDRWGPAPDVVDALPRDHFICRQTLPYMTVVVALEVAAVMCLRVRSRRGWPLAVKVLAVVLMVPSCGLHGLAWLITGLFAV